MITDPTQLLAQVAWETMVKNVRMITDWTYYITVSPENLNDAGAGIKQVGFYFIDNNGNQYSVTAVNIGGIETDIEVTDDFKCGSGPVTDRTGIVYEAVGDSRYLAQAMYSRLDSTAQDKGRAVDLAVLWDAIKKNFTELLDCPPSYIGQALKPLRVKATEDGIEFANAVAGGYEWWKVKGGLRVKYGYLYNWFALTDSRNIAPIGWRVATETDLRTLLGLGAYGDVRNAPDFMKITSPLDPTGWGYGSGEPTENLVVPTNSNGFSAVPSGYRAWGVTGISGQFSNSAWMFQISCITTSSGYAKYGSICANGDIKYDISIGVPKQDGYSCRLIKTSTSWTPGDTMTDNDGRVYPTVKIGNQVWMSANLMTTKYRNGDSIPEVQDGTAWANLTTGSRCVYNNDESNVFEPNEATINSTDVLEIVAGENVKVELVGKKLTISSVLPVPVNESVQYLTGLTPTWDISLGIHATLTLSGNTIITLSNLTAGQSGNLTITNPTAVYTLTFAGYTNEISPAIWKVDNQVITSGLTLKDCFSWYYDGTLLLWNGTNGYKP